MTQPSALRTAHAAPVPAWYRQVTAEQWKTFLTTFTGRLLPSALSHAVFSYFSAVQFRLVV